MAPNEETKPLTAEIEVTPSRRTNGGSGKRHDDGGQHLWTALRRKIPILLVIKVLVFVDMLSVALLVPLLASYFVDFGISTEFYGLVTSVYSSAQIIGGLVLGALSDRVLSRRSVLMLSFAGSALGYSLVGLSSSLWVLLAGRVVVGLVKQTMTIATAIVSEHTTAEERSAQLSRLTAAMTLSFIIGPSLGSALYQHNKKLPPLVSSSLLLLNVALVLFLVPCGGSSKGTSGDDQGGLCGSNKKDDGVEEGRESALGQFVKNLRRAGSEARVLRVLGAKLVYGFLMRSLTAQNFVGYYERRFGVETAVVGHMTSFRAALAFLVQLYAVKPLRALGSDSVLAGFAIALFTLSNLAEATPALIGLREWVAIVVPMTVVANSVLSACLESLFTQRVPKSDLGAALGTMNVLLSASGVVGPVYGAVVVGYTGILQRPAVLGAHFVVFCVLWWVTEVWRVDGGRRKLGKKDGGVGDGNVGETAVRSKDDDRARLAARAEPASGRPKID